MPSGSAELLLPIACERCGEGREWDDMLTGEPEDVSDEPTTWRKTATPCPRCGCETVLVTFHWFSQVES
jgi:hypothetical protein